MQEIEKVIDTVMTVLNDYERPLDVLLAVFAAWYLRRISNNLKIINKSSESPTVSAPAEKKGTVRCNKNGFSEEFKRGIELFYSDKKEEDMTEEEKDLFNRVAAFLEGK